MSAEIEHVSDTALWVAAFRAKETERPDALFQDPLASILVGTRGIEIAKRMPFPKILAWIMAVRTVAIDRLIQEAVKSGVDTVINIGAGLDTRPYRLELPKRVNWIEIDFSHIIRLKNEKLATQTPRFSLRRIELDFSNRQTAQDIYSGIGKGTQKALIITEGVIPYLTNEQAKDLAQDLFEIPTFEYWIQDYRKHSKTMRHPARLKKYLKKANDWDENFQFHFHGIF